MAVLLVWASKTYLRHTGLRPGVYFVLGCSILDFTTDITCKQSNHASDVAATIV